MSTAGASIDPAENPTPEPVRQAAPALELMGRIGYVAKGLLYGLMGVIALLFAAGLRRTPEDQRGTIDLVASQPLGKPLLVAVGLGLFGYSLWRIVQALWNPERNKIWQRLAHAVTGLIYLAVGFLALGASLGRKADDDRPLATTYAGQMIVHPIGRWLVLASGLLLLGLGLAQFANAAKKKFERTLKGEEMNQAEEKLAAAAGRAGFAARGLVFLMVGGYLASAAWRVDPRQAKGVEESLKVLSLGPYGYLILGLVGAGLIAYALFAFIQARYRRMLPA